MGVMENCLKSDNQTKTPRISRVNLTLSTVHFSLN